MPGTVQELASMFLEAIDSQSNVRDMGVVKEVVSTLERCPVSSSDLTDLRRTQLGKYINQVRRTIPDKSLAKRMKRLVIQWRSLAQQSPSNGGPALIAPPSLTTTTTPSPPSPNSTVTPAPAQNSLPTHLLAPTQPNAPLLTDLQTTIAVSSRTPSPSPALSQPSRPSSANPAINRKRAMHRLSKCPPIASQPQKASRSSSPQSLSAPLSVQLTPTPSPPLLPSSSQNHATPSAQSTQPVVSTIAPTVDPSLPLSSSLSTVEVPSESASGEGMTAATAPSSLQVRFPLHSVVKSLVVKIPLAYIRVLGARSSASIEPPATLLPPPIAASPSAGEVKTTESKPHPFVVSISRQFLQHKSNLQQEISARNGDAAGQPPPTAPTPTGTSQCKSVLLAQNESSSSSPDPPSPAPSSPPHLQRMPNGHCPGHHGSLGSDGVWYGWTEPIIYKDDLAVNVLPYVYIDGLDDVEDACT